jgi:hypothetical protein
MGASPGAGRLSRLSKPDLLNRLNLFSGSMPISSVRDFWPSAKAGPCSFFN